MMTKQEQKQWAQACRYNRSAQRFDVVAIALVAMLVVATVVASVAAL